MEVTRTEEDKSLLLAFGGGLVLPHSRNGRYTNQQNYEYMDTFEEKRLTKA